MFEISGAAVDMSRVRIPCDAIFPFLLGHPEYFNCDIEDDERIVITFKHDALRAALPAITKETAETAERFRLTATKAAAAVEPPLPRPVVRPKFTYHIKDRRLTPELAKKMGFSDPRLKVYQAIWDAKKGAQAKDIMAATKLPHGSVRQILHWLRKQNLVTGEPGGEG